MQPGSGAVKDIDVSCNEIVVREGKGNKDRVGQGHGQVANRACLPSRPAAPGTEVPGYPNQAG